MNSLFETVQRYVDKTDNAWASELKHDLSAARREWATTMERFKDKHDGERQRYLEEVLESVVKRLYPQENWEAEIETVMNVKGVARGERVWALEKRVQAWGDEIEKRVEKLDRWTDQRIDQLEKSIEECHRNFKRMEAGCQWQGMRMNRLIEQVGAGGPIYSPASHASGVQDLYKP